MQVIPHLVAAIVTMMDLFVTVIVIILQTWLQVVVEVAHTFWLVMLSKRNETTQSKAKQNPEIKCPQKLPRNYLQISIPAKVKFPGTISPLGDQPLFGFKAVISNIQNSPEPTDFFIY